jgi:DNA polymerase-3 subunit delta
LRHTTGPPAPKNARWKAFLAAVDKSGVRVSFDRKEGAELTALLCRGAARRGVRLSEANARRLAERAGNDLHRLFGELDKLAALAEGGDITAAMIDAAVSATLEARVFDLSKALMRGAMDEVFRLLDVLFGQKEDPIMVLAVLSGAFVDIYRAAAARASGIPSARVGEAFGYGNKSFRLDYAARDGARLSMEAVRRCLDALAEADTALKSSAADKRVVLEQTVARLHLLMARR